MTEKSYCLPEHLGVVSIQGQDADKLLQGQTTADFTKLKADNGITGAICGPKGRAYANFIAVRKDNAVLLIMPLSVIEHFIKTIGKYAVFFKLEIKDASKAFHLLGQLNTEHPAYSITEMNQQFGLQLSGHRILWFADPMSPQYEGFLEVFENQAQAVDSEVWQLADIQNGFVWIEADDIDKWIPQQINLHAIDAISFTKGCYTGQEIVARLNYKGKLKNWTHLVSTSQPITASEIVTQDGKKIGEIVNKVNYQNQFVALANLTEASLETPLFFNQEGNPGCKLENLPYTVKTSQ